ncbi:MAG: hypothetical protein COB08_005435 [Rhodobacteraceae bacterium]|nr:hypothetical protein [Paracoccaceae bacterium]
MLETAIIFALLSLPLSIPATFALARTKPKQGRAPFLSLYNHASAIGLVRAAQILFFVLLTAGLYHFYGCSFGLIIPADCEHLDASAGDLLFKTYFFGIGYLVWIGIPTVLMYISAEIVTRFRQRKSDQNA